VISSLVAPPAVVLDALGQGSFALQVPALPAAFAGSRMHFAALGLDENAQLVHGSNPVPITFR